MDARVSSQEPVVQVAPGHPAVITQVMLGQYVELCRLLRRREELRSLILQLLEAGGPVEAGPLTAEVRRGERHQLTASGAKAVVGEDNYWVFMSEIPPVPYRQLVVHEQGRGDEEAGSMTSGRETDCEVVPIQHPRRRGGGYHGAV